MSNGNGSVAPHCPISHSQDPSNPRGTAPTRLPAIPIATDLPSLIRAVNIMRDILRNITTSLTVNNTYLPRAPRQPKVYGDRNYTISPFPDWYQVEIENEAGYVGKDPKARGYVERLHKVVFRNNERDDDNLFKWLYKKPLTGRGESSVEPFKEDFFERLVKVKWKKEEPKKSYSATWFWNIHCIGSNTPIESGCAPWEPVPPGTGNLLFAPDEFTKWDNPKITQFGQATNFILIGKPVGSGGGSSNNHTSGSLNPHGDIFNPDTITVIGEHISVPVTAVPLEGPPKCWGSGPYPPEGIWAYWHVFCKIALSWVRVPIGTVSIDASGISATTLEGRPLKKVRTEISVSGRAQGGVVIVSFEEEDD